MEAGPRGRTMTHDLPRNDADNGEPVVPADQRNLGVGRAARAPGVGRAMDTVDEHGVARIPPEHVSCWQAGHSVD